MKNLILSFLTAVFLSISAFAQVSDVSIVPQPKSLSRQPGEFKLNYKTKIYASDETGRKSAGILNDLLMQNYGFKLEYTEKAVTKDAVVFLPQSSAAGESNPEAYKLTISPKDIQIGGSETGQFYALQTLMQILPPNFKGDTKLPAVNIADAPRFAYRGLHLDTTRHFMPLSFVKKYIDLMSQYKFNRFHWHLTDDQGWRIEIKKYPRLTEIGSKRPESAKGRVLNPYVGDGVPVEGFYTQEQIKEVVAYAKARHINIIPEIEIPGHSSAALTAYPNLGCKTDYQYKVQTTWGIFKEVFCPKEETFQFLEDVLTETIALFPDSPYVHIGGDEVLKDFWKESPEVDALKKRENLKDEHEVQSYFVRRMEKFINSKGKKIIGWDEILEGGVAPNATVMSWRGEKGGIESAKAGHDVIMTPNTYLYFDYGQGDPKYEPLNIGSYIPLEKVYSYDPIPQGLTPAEAKYILGAQANIWTEYLKTPEAVEYMAFPRVLALSEDVWSPAASKNFADFSRRLQNQYPRLDRQNVNYRIPSPEGLRNILISDTDKAKIELKVPVEGGKIFYTLDGSEPNEKSKLYEKPFELTLKPNEKVEIKTIVVNSKNRKSIIYAATVLRREKMKPVERAGQQPGASFKFYKGGFSQVKDLETAAPLETGETKSIMLRQFAAKTNDLKDNFGASFEAYINAPEDAIYEFELESDDGALLTIDDEPVVDLDGPHAAAKQSGLVPLSKGYHKIRLRYFQAGGDAALNLRWGVKGTTLNRISGNELVH